MEDFFRLMKEILQATSLHVNLFGPFNSRPNRGTQPTRTHHKRNPAALLSEWAGFFGELLLYEVLDCETDGEDTCDDDDKPHVFP